jgi:hypothetical protein
VPPSHRLGFYTRRRPKIAEEELEKKARVPFIAIVRRREGKTNMKVKEEFRFKL